MLHGGQSYAVPIDCENETVRKSNSFGRRSSKQSPSRLLSVPIRKLIADSPLKHEPGRFGRARAGRGRGLGSGRASWCRGRRSLLVFTPGDSGWIHGVRSYQLSAISFESRSREEDGKAGDGGRKTEDGRGSKGSKGSKATRPRRQDGKSARNPLTPSPKRPIANS